MFIERKLTTVRDVIEMFFPFEDPAEREAAIYHLGNLLLAEHDALCNYCGRNAYGRAGPRCPRGQELEGR